MKDESGRNVGMRQRQAHARVVSSLVRGADHNPERGRATGNYRLRTQAGWLQVMKRMLGPEEAVSRVSENIALPRRYREHHRAHCTISHLGVCRFRMF